MNLSHLYVDFSIIEKNINSISKRLNSVEDIILVIKADGYGIGAIEFAKQAKKMGIKSFAVARLEEAIELRNSGIDEEIIVLANILNDSFHTIGEYNLVTAITDVQTLNNFIQFYENTTKHASIHLNVNTGMNRLGIAISDLESCLTRLKSAKNIHLKGIYTHFASADDTNSSLTNQQGKLFQDIYSSYKPYYMDVVFHASNSSGLMGFPEYAFDKVRIGVAALGYSASQKYAKHWNVAPSLKLTSKIIQIQTIHKGAGIGYNHTFFSNTEMKVATVGIGYADGVQRCLSNKGFVLAKGIKCPIVGNVSMDLISIDISNVEINVGEEVTIFGESESNNISLEEIAEQINSVPYEIITQINPRVKRVYLNRR